MLFDNSLYTDPNLPDNNRGLLRDYTKLNTSFDKAVKAQQRAKPWYSFLTGLTTAFIPFVGGAVGAGINYGTDVAVTKHKNQISDKLNHYRNLLGLQQHADTSSNGLDLYGAGASIGNSVATKLGRDTLPGGDTSGFNLPNITQDTSLAPQIYSPNNTGNPTAPQAGDGQQTLNLPQTGYWGNEGGGASGLLATTQNGYTQAPPTSATMRNGGKIKGGKINAPSHEEGGAELIDKDGDEIGIEVEGNERIVNDSDWTKVMALLHKGKSKNALSLLKNIDKRKPVENKMTGGGNIPFTEGNGIYNFGNGYSVPVTDITNKMNGDADFDRYNREKNTEPTVDRYINYLGEVKGVNPASLFNSQFTQKLSPQAKYTSAANPLYNPFTMNTMGQNSLPINESPYSINKIPVPTDDVYAPVNTTGIQPTQFTKTTLPITASAVAPTRKFDWKNALDNTVDAAKLGLGLGAAMKTLPKYEIPPDWTNYMDKARYFSEQGLLPEEKAQLVDQTNQAYAAQVRDINNASGGNQGAVLANLGNANLGRFRVLANLALADREAKQNNFDKFGNRLLTDVNMKKDIFDREYNAALANKTEGIGLASDALANLSGRMDYNKFYGEGSYFDKLQKALAEKGASEAEIAKLQVEYAQNPAFVHLAEAYAKNPSAFTDAEIEKKAKEIVDGTKTDVFDILNPTKTKTK